MATHLPNEILYLIASYCAPSSYSIAFTSAPPLAPNGVNLFAWGLPKLTNIRLVSSVFNVGVGRGTQRSFSGTVTITDDTPGFRILKWMERYACTWILARTVELRVRSKRHGFPHVLCDEKISFLWSMFAQVEVVVPVVRLALVGKVVDGRYGLKTYLRLSDDLWRAIRRKLQSMYLWTMACDGTVRRLEADGMPERVRITPLVIGICREHGITGQLDLRGARPT